MAEELSEGFPDKIADEVEAEQVVEDLTSDASVEQDSNPTVATTTRMNSDEPADDEEKTSNMNVVEPQASNPSDHTELSLERAHSDQVASAEATTTIELDPAGKSDLTIESRPSTGSARSENIADKMERDSPKVTKSHPSSGRTTSRPGSSRNEKVGSFRNSPPSHSPHPSKPSSAKLVKTTERPQSARIKSAPSTRSLTSKPGSKANSTRQSQETLKKESHIHTNDESQSAREVDKAQSEPEHKTESLESSTLPNDVKSEEHSSPSAFAVPDSKEEYSESNLSESSHVEELETVETQKEIPPDVNNEEFSEPTVEYDPPQEGEPDEVEEPEPEEEQMSEPEYVDDDEYYEEQEESNEYNQEENYEERPENDEENSADNEQAEADRFERLPLEMQCVELIERTIRSWCSPEWSYHIQLEKSLATERMATFRFLSVWSKPNKLKPVPEAVALIRFSVITELLPVDSDGNSFIPENGNHSYYSKVRSFMLSYSIEEQLHVFSVSMSCIGPSRPTTAVKRESEDGSGPAKIRSSQEAWLNDTLLGKSKLQRQFREFFKLIK